MDPTSEPEFLAILHRRQPTHWQGSSASCFRGFLDWAAMRDALESGSFPIERLRVMKNGARVLDVFYAESGRAIPDRLDHLLDHGASIIMEPANPCLPSLERLCASIRKATGERVRAAIVLTTGPGGAIPIHYDDEDLLVLQIEGTKRWLIHGPPVLNPSKGAPRAPAPTSEPIFDVLMQAGDVLLLPAGYWHHCENQSPRSLHCALLIVPLAAPQVVKMLYEDILASEAWRRPILRGNELATAEAALKAALIELVQSQPLAELARRHVRDGSSAALSSSAPQEASTSDENEVHVAK